jgi:solute carrier family 25 iron transporter 28/37
VVAAPPPPLPSPSRPQTHLQAAPGGAGGAGGAGAPAAPSFAAFVRREGFARLWRGAPAVLLGCIPSHAAYFSAYEAAKAALGADGPDHTPIAAAATGALATTVHDGVLTPMDVVKQRLQLGYYAGVRDAAASIARTEGISAFWRSFPTTLAMNVPYAAVVVATNESLRRALAPLTGGGTLSTYLLAGAGAGALAAAATCPLDVIKTRLQTAAVFAAAPPRAGGGAGGGDGGGAGGSGAAGGGAGAGGTGAGKGGDGLATSRVPRGALPALSTPVALLYTQSGSAGAAASPPPARRGAVAIAQALLREEGAGAFFRGVRARMAVAAPSQAVSWAAYETMKAMLAREFGPGRRDRDA